MLGVYPQGRRQVYRLRTHDGASTLCCAEHLWHVYTASDRRRGKPGRVLETQEMIGRLRAAHQHRFELPLLSAPAEFEPSEVPIDPYALGLLLGDGCLTTSSTPTFATEDPELVTALEASLPEIELRHKSGVDYTLRNFSGHRGGVIVANPVTAALRELGLAGTRSHTKFVPEPYLHNSAAVRIALLQGLLDSDGGPVVQKGRTCRIQYTTCSERLRDDVVYLVRSLGGIAYSRRRQALGRTPGLAAGRPVVHRHDAFVIDLRLPAGVEPFRLQRKQDLYHQSGGGRPMRFIESIEPVGVMDTVCIQVAAADSLYVTDDCLVTHNTLNDSFIILDEAQNTSPEQMKMFLTRLGFNSRVVVTGDITQIDLPREQDSGLVVVSEILESSRESSSSASAKRMWSGTSWSAGSSPPTPNTRSDPLLSSGLASGRDARDRGHRRSTLATGGLTPTRSSSCARSRSRPPGSRTDTSRSSSSTSPACASSTASTAARTRRPTCSPSRSTRTARPPARASSATWLSARAYTTDLREAVVHGVLHLSGMDHETDAGEMLAVQMRILSGVAESERARLLREPIA